MSRVAVRRAIVDFFSPPAVRSLNTVFSSQPKIVQEQDFYAGRPEGTETGAVGYPEIAADEEERIALGGQHGGYKRESFEVHFTIRMLSVAATAEEGQDEFDAVIDAFKARLRSDRTLEGAVFQAGEGDGPGTRDIHVVDVGKEVDAEAGAVWLWATLQFHVVMILPNT